MGKIQKVDVTPEDVVKFLENMKIDKVCSLGEKDSNKDRFVLDLAIKDIKGYYDL